MGQIISLKRIALTLIKKHMGDLIGKISDPSTSSITLSWAVGHDTLELNKVPYYNRPNTCLPGMPGYKLVSRPKPCECGIEGVKHVSCILASCGYYNGFIN